MLFNLTRRTKLVKRALGHPGKNVDHGIYAILLIAFGKRDHFNAEGKERTIKESVHQEHLT
jgi:hypothetical protein